MSTISSLACPLCGGPLRSIWARRRRDGRLARRRCGCGYTVQTVEQPCLKPTPDVVSDLLGAPAKGPLRGSGWHLPVCEDRSASVLRINHALTFRR